MGSGQSPQQGSQPGRRRLRLLTDGEDEARWWEPAEEDHQFARPCAGVKVPGSPRRWSPGSMQDPGAGASQPTAGLDRFQCLFQDEEDSARQLHARGRWALQQIQQLSQPGGTLPLGEDGPREQQSRLRSLLLAEDAAQTWLGDFGTLAPEPASPQEEGSGGVLALAMLYSGLPTVLGTGPVSPDEECSHVPSPRVGPPQEEMVEPTTSLASVTLATGQRRKVTKTTASRVTFAPGPPVTHGPPPEAEQLPAPCSQTLKRRTSCLRKVGASGSQASFTPTTSGLSRSSHHSPGHRVASPHFAKHWSLTNKQSKDPSPGFLGRPCLAAGGDEDICDDGFSDVTAGSQDDRFRDPLEDSQDGSISDLMGDIQDGRINDLMADTQDICISDSMGDTQDGGLSDLMGDTKDGGLSDLMGDTQDGGSSDLMRGSQDGGSSDLMGDTQDGGSSILLADSQDSGSSDTMADDQGGGGSDLLADSRDDCSSDTMASSQDGECSDLLVDTQDGGCSETKERDSLGLVESDTPGISPADLSQQPGQPPQPLAYLEMELPLAVRQLAVEEEPDPGPKAQPDNMEDVYTEMQQDMFYKAFLFHKFMRLGGPQHKPNREQGKQHP
ncbi:uncharacterized protein LOC127567101 [Pristis pectinata]|uniref:uncharacterized protein LOC127567101 n=1 Tax=Pristis pectinata TaxID=685728 RepID=UPI00223CCE4D|nr:uncharacterized protein LOC127567101 [Pristis pectinata]